MNSSRRPSPLGANTGDPNNLGMPLSSGWNAGHDQTPSFDHHDAIVSPGVQDVI
jgi:hypothetical protein